MTISTQTQSEFSKDQLRQLRENGAFEDYAEMFAADYGLSEAACEAVVYDMLWRDYVTTDELIDFCWQDYL